MADTQGEAQPARPPRRRGRRVRTFARHHPMAAAVLLLVAVTLGVRLWWGSHVGRQVAAHAAAIRARGEPVDPEDYTITPLPDAENAWTLQGRAAKLDAAVSPAQTSDSFPSYPPFGDKWDKAARASEQANGPTFALARQARQRPRGQMTQRLASPMFMTLLPGLNQSRQLALTLADGATHKHLAGDDVEALERLLDCLHVARTVHQEPFVVSQLVGIGIGALAANRAMIIAPGLRLDDPEVRRRTADLIAAFADERDLRDEFGRGLLFERLATADGSRSLAAGTWAIRPLADREADRANTLAAVSAAAAKFDNAEDARRLLKTLPDDRPSDEWSLLPDLYRALEIPRYSRWFGQFTQRSWGRYFEQRFRAAGERRATAVALAAQLYRADHKRWPDRLDQLVPAYLPAVPADPFYADRRPIGYVVLRGGLPNGGDRPLVYYDAGQATDAPPDTEPMYDWQNDLRENRRRQEIRQYRDLARWVPKVRRFDVEERERLEAERQEQESLKQLQASTQPSSTQPSSTQPSPEAVGDDPKKPEAPRDDAEQDDGAKQ